MAAKKKTTTKAPAKKPGKKPVAEKQEAPKWIPAKQYAQRIGVTTAAVTNAFKAGRFGKTAVKRGRGYSIKIPDADEYWENNKKQIQTRPDNETENQSNNKTKKTEAVAGDPAGDVVDSLNVRINKSKADHERFKALKAEADYNEQIGNLISVERIKKEEFRRGREMREMIMSLPARVAHSLAAALGIDVDPHQVNKVLDEEIREMLAEVARNSERYQGSEPKPAA